MNGLRQEPYERVLRKLGRWLRVMELRFGFLYESGRKVRDFCSISFLQIFFFLFIGSFWDFSWGTVSESSSWYYYFNFIGAWHELIRRSRCRFRLPHPALPFHVTPAQNVLPPSISLFSYPPPPPLLLPPLAPSSLRDHIRVHPLPRIPCFLHC